MLRRCYALLGTKREKMRDRIKKQLEMEELSMGLIAHYPHRSLTRATTTPISAKEFGGIHFTQQLAKMRKIATDLETISLCAPKINWDAQVIIVRRNLRDADFDVIVNPESPGYDDRTSVVPMYGFWEACCSCSNSTAWVLRPQEVNVNYFSEFGEPQNEVMRGLRARAVMHEMDHLIGVTPLQRALGPDFIVSYHALQQRHLWPAAYPSQEAHMTGIAEFFDYVQNIIVVPPEVQEVAAATPRTQFNATRIGDE